MDCPALQRSPSSTTRVTGGTGSGGGVEVFAGLQRSPSSTTRVIGPAVQRLAVTEIASTEPEFYDSGDTDRDSGRTAPGNSCFNGARVLRLG